MTQKSTTTETYVFMYQNQEESQREIEVAKKILNNLPKAIRTDDLTYRTWNLLPYHRYRGSDETSDEK